LKGLLGEGGEGQRSRQEEILGNCWGGGSFILTFSAGGWECGKGEMRLRLLFISHCGSSDTMELERVNFANRCVLVVFWRFVVSWLVGNGLDLITV